MHAPNQGKQAPHGTNAQKSQSGSTLGSSKSQSGSVDELQTLSGNDKRASDRSESPDVEIVSVTKGPPPNSTKSSDKAPFPKSPASAGKKKVCIIVM